MKAIIKAIIIVYLFFYLLSMFIIGTEVAVMEPCVGAVAFLVTNFLAVIMFTYYVFTKNEKSDADEKK